MLRVRVRVSLTMGVMVSLFSGCFFGAASSSPIWTAPNMCILYWLTNDYKGKYFRMYVPDQLQG